MYRHSSQLLRTGETNMRQSSPKLETNNSQKNTTNHVTFQRTFKVNYLGYAVLDRRYTLSMLPWLVAEIKRHGSRNEEIISIEVTEQSLKARSCLSDSLVFEHKLQTISKFAQTSQDPACFTYMTREVASGPCAYHVFQAVDENTVNELFTSMKETSKELLSHKKNLVSVTEKAASGTTLESVINSCQQYEVLYLGRIKVSGKRAPPTFIDEAVEKFRIYELEKAKNFPSFGKRKRHGSGASISSLPHNLEILENVTENSLQKDVLVSSREELSSSSGVSSCESISQKSLDTNTKIYCDTDPAFLSPQSSLSSSDYSFNFPSHTQSLVTHSQSMDISATCQMLNEFKSSDMKNNLMPPSSLISHTQSLDAPASADIVRDLRDFDPSIPLRDRVRSCSGDIPRAKQTSLPTYHQRSVSGLNDVGRPRSYTSPSSSDYRHTNRTMLFLIGRVDICLIGTDKKQMLLSKQFNDIAHCSQGVKHLDHFGFICRETTLSGAECYAGYIFRCQTEKTVDEMMQTLKQAFSRAHQNYQKLSESTTSVPRIFICDSCPMHWFHTLCYEVEGLSQEDTHLIILRRLGTLPDCDKEKIIVKFQQWSINDDVQQQNEVLMMLIREFSEQKQLKHVHEAKDGKNNGLNGKEKSSKLDSFREKARKSLSSSFETFLKLTSRDDLKEANLSLTQRARHVEEHVFKDLDTRSYREGSCDSNKYLYEQTSPVSSRPRSSTFSSSREIRQSSQKQNICPVNKKPIMNMFLKSETSSPSSNYSEAKGSWRQAIFHRVQTPGRGHKQGDHDNDTLEAEQTVFPKKSKEELRALWKKAIIEQILLIRMERENRKLQVNQDAVCHKRMKLNYEEVTPCIKTATREWERILNDPNRVDFHKDKSKLIDAVKKGVPRHKRGEIWQYLAEQNRSWNNVKDDSEDFDMSYEELLKQLTSHQHSILIDIGRTFPNHAFYSQTLGPGQLSLFNLLKAYSLFDQEVGYCQGLSFVAGILLLHMPEEDAFFMMKYLMFDLGLRNQYKTDMVAFQVQMYQLSRLVHDNYLDLDEHLSKFEISSTLYAAPWFLTVFASQFPVGFVARLFDLLFLFGMDVIFKVSLLLLGRFKDCIMNCDNFETVMNFLKNSIPSIDVLEMQILFTQVFNLDISRQLHAFEVEYHVLSEERALSPMKNSKELEKLRETNKMFKSKNMELIEKLQLAYSRIHSLENSEASLKSTVRRLEERVTSLQDEKEALFHSLRILKMRMDGKQEVGEDDVSEHPPLFKVVYSGTEKDEDESFRALLKEFCSKKGSMDSKSTLISPLPDDITEENVFEDPDEISKP
ncbi:hypothetical protein JTE90_016030 [Oedothorax gibbosus]|uniref:TBC1 domain family member 1 n=1 Tax=Oedothorax gibbosus TaxID=931172 RepID=A0AAV6VRT7_9ARAC|nr:hypothetical protein JTE90_016030 [Oedothorax gibbosus]